MLDVDRFIRDGFVKIESAFDRELGLRCQEQLWATTGLNPDDPGTWTESLVRVTSMGTTEFTATANTEVLTDAYDALVGVGNWRPRLGLGTFPLRFPSDEPPRDAGWHVEGSFYDADGPRLSLRSRGRALLMLFLFSDVGPDDAPTAIRVGSHVAVPPVLARHGPDGAPWMPVCQEVVPATEDYPVVARPDGSATSTCAIPSSSIPGRRTGARCRASWPSHRWTPSANSTSTPYTRAQWPPRCSTVCGRSASLSDTDNSPRGGRGVACATCAKIRRHGRRGRHIAPTVLHQLPTAAHGHMLRPSAAPHAALSKLLLFRSI